MLAILAEIIYSKIPIAPARMLREMVNHLPAHSKVCGYLHIPTFSFLRNLRERILSSSFLVRGRKF